MITVHTIEELRQHVRQAREQGRRIGFVPTMGNLHDGHIRLVDHAKADDCFTVASIFVNPLQFNDASDLERYPRTLTADQKRLEAAATDLLFAPDVDEMYPHGQAQQSRVHVPGVSAGLCGGSRPGHFDGVATVVTKLFNMVQPDRAYFGEKDFQQVAVIHKMVDDLNVPITIVPVATARADDGLALSSRNGYLSPEERAIAPGLYRTLQHVLSRLQAHTPLAQALAEANEQLQQLGFIPDYVAVCHAHNVQSVQSGDTVKDLVILAAAHLGNARLIDNIHVTLNQRIE